MILLIIFLYTLNWLLRAIGYRGPVCDRFGFNCYTIEYFQESPHYYTIQSVLHDGFGAQYHAIMSGIAYTTSKRLTYVHSPLVKIADIHNVIDLSKMNDFIGVQTTPMAQDISNVETDQHSKEVHFSDNPSMYYTPEVIQTIKDFYYSTEKPNIERNDIAIHVRRGDVNEENGWPLKDKHGKLYSRYSSNKEYTRIITALKKAYPTYHITLHSQGNVEDFSDLLGDNINCKLNGDICHTFHSFVTAKVLVTAKSSLSYAAAILNEGTVYYQEFWHKPLDGWKNTLTL